MAQLVAVLLLSGILRAGWAHRHGTGTALPGTAASPSHLADSAGRLAAEEARRSAPLGPDERLDPNLAPEAELDRLPGIGPRTARAIVEARDTLPFRVPGDLLRVRGIGEGTLARMEPHLELRATLPVRRPRGTPTAPFARAEGATGGSRDPVDVNRATPQELERLPGVGPVLAERIVAYRLREGPFRKPEDLLPVPGIGPAVLRRILPGIRF